MSPKKQSSLSTWSTASRFSYVGIFFGVAIVIGFLAGRFVERRWGGAPWVSLVGVLFGVATGFRELIRVAQAYNREAGPRASDVRLPDPPDPQDAQDTEERSREP